MAKEVCAVVLQRWEVINRLREEALDKRTLVEDLDCSRSTVNRAVRELEAIGVVDYADGKYVVTPLGESVASRFKRMMKTVELRSQLAPFLRWMPEEKFDLDLVHLRGAELLLPKQGDPYAMINRHVQLLREADKARGMLPLTGLQAHEAAHENIVENGAEGELIVEPDVADVLVADPQFAELTDEMLATGRFNLFIYDGTIPYFVGIFDDETVQIGVDEEGDPQAIVETDRPEVQAWAHDTLREYEQQATPLTHTVLHDQPEV